MTNSVASPGESKSGSSALHLEDSGSGPPVVFLHSSGMSGRQWKRLAASSTERGFRALVPDLTGHGKSPVWPSPQPFSYRDDVQNVLALLDGLDAPAHLVGHSYGGLIAFLAAVAVPPKIASLSLYDPVSFGLLDPARDDEAFADLRRVPAEWEDTPEGRDRWIAAFVDYWGGVGAWQVLREEARAEFRRVAWVLYRGVTTLVRDETRAAACSALKFPVLLLTGETTPIAERRVVARLGEAFPHAQTVVIAGAGHMGPLTHADQVNKTILDFLTSSAGR